MKDELERLAALRAPLEKRRAEGTITIDELLDLAAYYMGLGPPEPYMDVYREILRRDPEHIRARIMLAHSYAMLSPRPEYLETAAHIIKELTPLGGEPEAACGIISSTMYFILKLEKPKQYVIGDHIAVLERSVRLCPHWFFNRGALSQLYESQGRFEEALEQMEAAVNNMLPGYDPSWGPHKATWEHCIAGRAGADETQKNRLIEEIQELRAKVERARRRAQIWRSIRRLWHWRAE